MSEATPKQLMAFGAVGVSIGVVLFAIEPRWVEATGRVTAVWVNTDQGRLSRGYQPFVMYRYEVDGRPYRQESFWCGAPGVHPRVSRAEALADAARIKVGDPLPIIYDSGSPEESTCLVSTRHWYKNYAALGPSLLGAIFLFIGAREWATARPGAD